MKKDLLLVIRASCAAVVLALCCGHMLSAQPTASRDKLTIACVNFNAVWGDKAANLAQMRSYITKAAQNRVDILVFPELALTGYMNGPKNEMHRRNAETIPGPSTRKIAALTRELGMYVIFGMPERSSSEQDIFYNSAAVIGPAGVIGSYAKLMPTRTELMWCAKGEKPFAFESPWGLIGVGICYDSYMFPELPRYYAALGARLYLHITALAEFPGWREYYLNQMQARAIENMMFIASANLVGPERSVSFTGTSFIAGPGAIAHQIKYFAGPADNRREYILTAALDLSAADRMRKRFPLFTPNPVSRTPDWRLDLYLQMLQKIKELTRLPSKDQPW